MMWSGDSWSGGSWSGDSWSGKGKAGKSGRGKAGKYRGGKGGKSGGDGSSSSSKSSSDWDSIINDHTINHHRSIYVSIHQLTNIARASNNPSTRRRKASAMRLIEMGTTWVPCCMAIVVVSQMINLCLTTLSSRTPSHSLPRTRS